MPAALELVGDALDGLMELALNLARFRRQLLCYGLPPFRSVGPCIAHHVAVDAAEEALDALDASVLPVEVAIGRRGEEAVEAGGLGAATGDHFLRGGYIRPNPR